MGDIGSTIGSRGTVYRRTQAGERKLSLLRSCEPVRPPGEGETPLPSLSIPAHSPENAPNVPDSAANMARPAPSLVYPVFPPLVCTQWACGSGAIVGIGAARYCRKHARQLILSLENALAFAEGEG